MKRIYTFFSFSTNLESGSKELLYLYKSHLIKSYDKYVNLSYFLSFLTENEKKMYHIGKYGLTYINQLSKERTKIIKKERRLIIDKNNPKSYLSEIIKRVDFHYEKKKKNV